MRALRVAVLCLFACACAGDRALWNRDRGIKAGAEGRNEECAARLNEAVAFFSARTPGAAAPLGLSYHGRAYCLKALGKTAEAIADISKSIKYLNEHCYSARNDPVDQAMAKRDCRLAAEDSEMFSRWTKELQTRQQRP